MGDGRNVALNYQVNRWCARSSKGTILYYQLSMPNNFHNSGGSSLGATFACLPKWFALLIKEFKI